MKRFKYYLVYPALFLAIFAGTSLINPQTAAAYNPSNIISDGEFNDWQTMDAAGIQWFLDAHGASRIRTFKEGGKTAAQIIYNAAVANRVNPYVILATIQKEESIIESNNNFDYRAKWAMGYGVCDRCDSDDPALQKYAGFTKQVTDGTWQLKRNYSYWASTGDWKVGHSMVIDGTTVTFANRATSALYRYTPHLHGNENFAGIYNRYKTYRPPATYDAKLLSQVPRATYAARPGQRIKMLVVMRNTGTAVWTKNGANAMHIGNYGPQDRSSAFTNNQNLRWEMIQASARRNGAGTFTIWFTAPQEPGTYVEKFRPVMEGVNWFGPEITYTIKVTGNPVVTKGAGVKGQPAPATTSPMTTADKKSLINR
ncbi:MAG: hypothetical protein HW405_373 [Candidatus Berkelbacteria bacterium]|nr:hypothetical protein [Candidatus Berkelbacteria bacterium]